MNKKVKLEFIVPESRNVHLQQDLQQRFLYFSLFVCFSFSNQKNVIIAVSVIDHEIKNTKRFFCSIQIYTSIIAQVPKQEHSKLQFFQAEPQFTRNRPLNYS